MRQSSSRHESHNRHGLVPQTVYNSDREECMKLSADESLLFPGGLRPGLPLAKLTVETVRHLSHAMPCCLLERQKPPFQPCAGFRPGGIGAVATA